MAEARKIESWRKKGKVKTFSDVEWNMKVLEANDKAL